MFRKYTVGYVALMLIYGMTFTYASVVGSKLPSEFFSLTFSSSFQILIAPVFMAIGFLTVQMMRRGTELPLKTLYRYLRRERAWLGRGILFTYLVLPFATAFTTIKIHIPTIQPYYADPVFIKLDYWLFGSDPWRYTHMVFGYIPTLILDRTYLFWILAQLLLLVGLYFNRNQSFQLKGMISYQASWLLLGGVMATVLSSVGPCFYQEYFRDDRFLPLMETLNSFEGLSALSIQQHLLDMRGQSAFGVGISAMPSLHVGISWLIVLLTKERWGFGAMWLLSVVFFCLIAIGSVHLGWHYAVDGLVSIAGVWIIWRVTSAFVDRVVAKKRRGIGMSRPLPSLR